MYWSLIDGQLVIKRCARREGGHGAGIRTSGTPQVAIVARRLYGKQLLDEFPISR